MPRSEADILVLCDETFKRTSILESLMHEIGGDLVLTPPNPDAQSASARKTQIFDLVGAEKLVRYDAVLYLDADTIVRSSLTDLLHAVSESPDDGALHTMPEQTSDVPSRTQHSVPYFGHRYSSEELDRLEGFGRRALVFSAGTFAFRPTSATATQFEALCNAMRLHRGPSFWEQSHMNVHFCGCGKAEPTLRGWVYIPGHGAACGQSTDAPLVHFANATVPWRRKLEMMRATLAM